MNENILISIIMPVYKTAEKYLRKSIESVINQSYTNIELILIDDGSPDDCGKICEEYSLFDSRVRTIHKKNGGVSSARNEGIKNAYGNYLVFVDSDDEIKENMCETLLSLAKKNDSDIVVSSCNHIIKGKKIKNIQNIEYKNVCSSEAINNLAYNISVYDELEPTSVWGKLYKKEIIETLKFNENMSIAEDFIFNYYACINSNQITYYSEKLYNYNILDTSIMHNNEFFPKIMDSFKELLLFENEQTNSIYYEDIVARCVNIAFTIYMKTPSSKTKECRIISEYIKRKRKCVIFNQYIGIKVRIAIIFSFLGMEMVRHIFEFVSKVR